MRSYGSRRIADSEQQWPPRSPHEALLGTPGGRQRYREMMNRTSPSPSPMRSSRALAAVTSSTNAALIHLPHEDKDEDEDEEEGEDDEETLQLKLQEIQARLRLKKLQNAKARGQVTAQRSSETESKSSEPAPWPSPSRRTTRARTPGADENARPETQNTITVPASPVRKLQFLQQQTSPSRIYLGIDKGLKAKDISLKRVPSYRGNHSTTTGHAGAYLRRSRSVHSAVSASSEAPRPPTFNERLALARMQEAERTERKEKIQRVRTSAFGIDQDEMERYKKAAVEIPDEPLPARAYTRDEILSKNVVPASKLTRSKSTPNLAQRQHIHKPALSASTSDSKRAEDDSCATENVEEASFEAYSCLHLSKRILPHTVVTRLVSSKQMLNVKDVLREVKAPDFALPDVEKDVVIFAIVARKSEPRAHKPSTGSKQEDRGKYMVMTLTDLEFELDLFLFNTGFTRFWKLTEGTVVAILNPNIMPPPPGRQDTGRFSLVINSDEDTILEIGSARDLAFCQSVKKDGDLCGAWVNKKKTHFCEFHSNEAVRKQRATRQEVNSNGFGGWDGRGKYGGGSGSGGGGISKDFKKKNNNYDWETRSQWFATRSHSAADLLDGKDRTALDKKERAEFVKRSLEAKEKEHEMMKKLGQIGNAAGREYMQRTGLRVTSGRGLPSGSSGQQAGEGSSTGSQAAVSTGNDVMSLGLGSKDRTVHLSPIKRKRPESSRGNSTVLSGTKSSTMLASASASASASPFGWGSNLRDKLSKMKEGEKLHQGEPPPVRKKTRFVTDKGIREAGRESLGMDFSARQISLGDDDDDELVII
ncbi:hypothetical protein E4U61_003239 [Claviceps capensis]|nr:hypothetical protein E4U61_003239 [Claviceps capensis]